MYKEYDYVIVGAGIAGCCVAYFLKQYSKSILLIDKNEQACLGASGAAGAFLSPLLGKPNEFKDLVTTSLNFSTQFYKNLEENVLNNCGVCRIPKNKEDKEKFESYKSYIDFEYEESNEGYFFKIGSQITPSLVCNLLIKESKKLMNYKVEDLQQDEKRNWIINNEIKAKNLILTTGANTKLIKEKYFNIRAVWGQKIDIKTSTYNNINYHKECSVSLVTQTFNDGKYLLSLGATHHRFNCNKEICDYCIDSVNINSCTKCYNNDITSKDSQKLIALGNDIIKLDDVEVVDIKIGARACSVDYFPMVGKLVDSKATIEKFPHLINGSFVTDDKLLMLENLYVLNGVGGRGFVLSPYLAKQLVESIINNKKLEENIISNRLFKRWVKKYKLNNG